MTSSTSRFDRLCELLAQDPSNARLAADAAAAGLDEGRFADLSERLEPHLALASDPSPQLRNSLGIAALRSGDFATAATHFETLLQTTESPEVKFSLAWAWSRLGRHEAVLDLLDDAVVAVARQAAALKVEALHHLGRLEEALDWGRSQAANRPDDSDLAGALAIVALDEELLDEAAAFASRASSTPEGQAVFGMLALKDGRLPEALLQFDKALSASPRNARAQLGKGLALLSGGRAAEGVGPVEEAAGLFGDHLGSWIAAGWGRYAVGDNVTAREHFERALAIDDNFSEAHGGLAVMHLAAGEVDQARREIDVALRLDRNCLGAALAKSLLAARQGSPQAALRIRDAALRAPLGSGSESIGDMLVNFQRKAGLTNG